MKLQRHASDSTKKTGKFKIERGVKQRDTISPKLFTNMLENMFKMMGMNINCEDLNHLRFDDDIVWIDLTRPQACWKFFRREILD